MAGVLYVVYSLGLKFKSVCVFSVKYFLLFLSKICVFRFRRDHSYNLWPGALNGLESKLL